MLKQVCRDPLPVGVSDSYRNDPHIETLPVCLHFGTINVKDLKERSGRQNIHVKTIGFGSLCIKIVVGTWQKFML